MENIKLVTKNEDILEDYLYADLKMGLTYGKESSFFRVYAPSHQRMDLAVYKTYDDVYRKTYPMIKRGDFFELDLEGDLDGHFYTYLVGGKEVTDPYSVSASVNSGRSAIFDPASTDPLGFKDHKIPDNDPTKAVIYEVHVADFTGLESSGAGYRGKFLGMVEGGRTFEGLSTCLDHLVDLGVTHVHLLPIYDYISVDERKDITDFPENYNWGYDPELYNSPEGSYSTDPYDPRARVREFKTLVQRFHEAGISVVLDVVYNHTYKTLDSNFNVLAPNMYHRNISGSFYNGSGCGNEFWSDSDIGRKFIIESLLYWAEEYKVDGFRFDLMALIDIDTIEMALKKLKEINPNILIYGEPWMAQASLLPYNKQINIGSQKYKGFSIFNPDFRDAIKGDPDGYRQGYIQGQYQLKGAIQFGIAGSVDRTGQGLSAYDSPLESINYFNAHDNLIFSDKLRKSGIPEDKLEEISLLGFSILMTSQGLTFFVAGNEFLRDKKMDQNSYHSPISVNGIDWSMKKKHLSFYKKIKDLIALRKELGIFNMKTWDEVARRLTFIEGLPDYLIAYEIKKEDETYLIVHNAYNDKLDLDFLEEADRHMIWKGGRVDLMTSDRTIDAYSTNIYII